MALSKQEQLDARLKEIAKEIELETDGKRLQDLFSEEEKIESELNDILFRDF